MGCPCPWVTMRNAANQPPPLLAGLQRLPPAGARTYPTGLCSAFTVGGLPPFRTPPSLFGPRSQLCWRCVPSTPHAFPEPPASLRALPMPTCICFPQPVRGKASLRPLCVLTERPHPSLPCTTVTCVPTFPLEAIHAPGGPGSSRLYPCIAACSDLPCTEGFLKLLLNRAKGGI